ncbi:MAG: hypothetical protein RLY64_861 [Bacteroidota bacterium]
MKIALVGYGKMGQTIERLALERGHDIVAKIDLDSPRDLNQADVAIEFTRPDVVLDNLKWLSEAGVPTVVGTTGWYQHKAMVEEWYHSIQGALFTASNFSIGVNLFWEASAFLSKLFDQHPQYRASLHEIHHTQKLDAPSGTAITTAEVVLQHSSMEKWIHGPSPDSKTLPVTHDRIDHVPGTHTLAFTSGVDEIRMTHEAFSRDGFANGAIDAAEWLVGKKGIFGMKDLLGLGA